MSRTRRVAAVTAAVLLAAACASGARSSGDPARKVGGESGPLTITVADSQPGDKPSPAALREYARLVEGASDGAIRFEIVLDYGGTTVGDGSDEAVIEAVIGGDVDMAMVPARAWSTADVTSLGPLQAPFLVQSEQHLDAIVRDPDIVAGLFAGLDDVGVYGLTMLPEALRHPFSFTTPILTPDDIAGRHVRYLASAEVAAMIEALGATPVDISGDEYHDLVDDGTITATDSQFSIAISANPYVAIGTGNLILYPKVVTFVANAAFWDALGDDDRQLLADAAAVMQQRFIAARPSDADAAAEYCAAGGTVVLTDDNSLSGFREAVAPEYEELAADAVAARAIAAIDALAARADGTTEADRTVEPCGPPRAAMTYEDLVPRGGELPNGVYRVEFTDEYLRDQGVTDPFMIRKNHGVWTIRLEDGRWSVDQRGEGIVGDFSGIYQVDGNVLYFRWYFRVDNFTSMRWSVDADGTLQFDGVDPADDFTFNLPWERVGDVDDT